MQRCGLEEQRRIGSFFCGVVPVNNPFARLVKNANRRYYRHTQLSSHETIVTRKSRHTKLSSHPTILTRNYNRTHLLSRNYRHI